MRTARRRPLAATLIASAALALGAAAPASAAPSAEQVQHWAGPATPSALPQLPAEPRTRAEPAPAARADAPRPLPVAVQVPILEDPAEVAAARAATLPSTGVDVPVFLAAAVLGGLLGLGLCIVAARRA